MATIADIGVPGQPLSTPPLTAWQAAVRDALTPTLTALTPAAGFADYGAAFGGMPVTKQGREVVINAVLKPTADKALTLNTPVPLATVPAACVPAISVMATSFVYLASGGTPTIARMDVTAGGALSFTPTASGTLSASSGFVVVHLAYRSAS